MIAFVKVADGVLYRCDDIPPGSHIEISNGVAVLHSWHQTERRFIRYELTRSGPAAIDLQPEGDVA